MPLLSEGRMGEMWETSNKATTFLHHRHPELNFLSHDFPFPLLFYCFLRLSFCLWQSSEVKHLRSQLNT
jgi:hypothetical protein